MTVQTGTKTRPQCDEQSVLGYIACVPQGATLKAMQRFFSLSDDEVTKSLTPILAHLQRQKKISSKSASGSTNNTRYNALENFRHAELMVVRVDDVRTEKGKKQVYVSPVKRNAALPSFCLERSSAKQIHDENDIGKKLLVRVKARLSQPDAHNRLLVQCQIEQELQHEEPGILTGKVRKAANSEDFIFTPEARGIKSSFKLLSGQLSDLEDGDHILASISEDHNQTRGQPSFKPIERVWRPGHQSSKIGLHFLNKHNVRLRMPPKVEAEADRFGKNLSFKTYIDLRHLDLVTIDGRDVNERDDAVGAEPDKDPSNPGGYVMYTAIADASSFVPVGSSWDEMAMEVPFSIYAFGRNVDMLPKSVVHGKCSLDAGADRPAIVCKRRINKDGQVIESEFIAGIINVNENLSYDRVDKALDGAAPRPYASHIQRIVENHHKAVAIRQQFYSDMLIMEEDKTYPIFDESGMVKSLVHESASQSRHDIKISMIDNGILAWEFLDEAGENFFGRVHDRPDPHMVDRVARRLAILGIHMPDSQNGWIPTDYNDAIAKANEPGTPDFMREKVRHAILSGIKRASYNWNGEGHFGVATENGYVKATSPLRDYAQLVNQRAIKRAMGMHSGPIFVYEDEPESIQRFCTRLDYKEFQAADIQRQALHAYAIESMAPLSGKAVAAQIMNFSEKRGLTLRLDTCPVMFDIPLEGFEASPDGLGFRNVITNKQHRFGEFIDVKIKHADPLKSTIDIDITINQQDQTRKAQPGIASYNKHKQAPQQTPSLPQGQICNARVISASTKEGIKLELNLPNGKKSPYQWPRNGHSFSTIEGGVYMYPTKTSKRGMNFVIGNDVKVLVRASRKGTTIFSVEVPSEAQLLKSTDSKQVLKQKEKAAITLNSLQDLKDNMPDMN